MKKTLIFLISIIIGVFHFGTAKSYAANDAKEKKAESAYEDGTVANDSVNNNYETRMARTTKTTKRGKSGSKNPTVRQSSVDRKTYEDLVDDLSGIGEKNEAQKNRKVNIEGELRFHYAINSGAERWKSKQSGLRLYIGLNTEITKDWQLYGMFEAHKDLRNYDDRLDFARIYAVGKVRSSILQVGSFSYLMAEGNIYDSKFKGIRAFWGNPVKYSLGIGNTDSTKNTVIATARYESFDYSLEAGAYNYKLDDGSNNKNTIVNLSGNYNFSNFSIGAMYLGSKLKDEKGSGSGYVFSLNYGDLKTWRAGTYGIFAKYYNQPRYTYINHGMNGIGGRMNGFRGYGAGVYYTIKPNVVAGIEYYRVEDMITNEKGNTWWNQITYYF